MTWEQARAYATDASGLPFALPDSVRINEVGPRDGFQLEKATIPTDRKIEIIDALGNTGVDGIQVTAFVHPRVVPQLRDAEQVLSSITKREGIEYSALVPNLRGAERALSYRVDTWELMLSVSDSHNMANSRRTTAQSLAESDLLIGMAKDAGVEVIGGMATALGCPFEGRMEYERIAWVTSTYFESGVRRLNLADTAGVADPSYVYTTCRRLREDFPEIEFTLHLHDTRGLGLANALAGLAAGITRFDSSIGGLGGCPFSPGATGNIASEDLVHMLHLLGVPTGTNLDSLIDISRGTVTKTMSRQLDSALSRTDPSWVLHAATSQEAMLTRDHSRAEKPA